MIRITLTGCGRGVDFGKDHSLTIPNSYVEFYVGISRKSTDDRFKVHDHDSRVVMAMGRFFARDSRWISTHA